MWVANYVDKKLILRYAHRAADQRGGRRGGQWRQHSGGTTMFVVDATSLEIIGRLDLKPE